MIFGRLKDIGRYAWLPEGELSALRFAEAVTSEGFTKGRRDYDGERLYFNFAEYDTHPLEGALTEAHRSYVDVMVMVEGEETVYVKPTARLSTVTKEYSPDIEALLAKTDSDASAVRLKAGDFLLLYPEDAHAPGCIADSPCRVKKIIGKLLIEDGGKKR